MPRRVAVILTPTPYTNEWRAAFESLCAEAGFQFFWEAPGDPSDNDALALTEHPHLINGWDPTHWHVVRSTWQEGVAAAESWIPGEAAAVRYVANRLASVAMLARTVGAHVVAGPVQAVDGVGTASISARQIPTRSLTPLGSVLADLYGDASGGRVGTIMAPCWFSTPDGNALRGDVVELEGRARLLLTGPQIDLGPGLWRLVLRLEYGGSNQAASIRIHMAGHPETEDLVEELRRPGLYELSVEQRISMVSALSIDISVDRAAFSGFLRIVNCEVVQHARL